MNRILRKRDGLYYPQYKSFWMWKGFTRTVYPKVQFVPPFTEIVSFKTLEECEEFIGTHTPRIYTEEDWFSKWKVVTQSPHNEGSNVSIYGAN